MKYFFRILDGEVFWGGSSEDGIFAPFDKKTELTHDFNVECENQTMPLFLSNRGRCIFSPKPFKVKISDGVFEIEGEDESSACEALKAFCESGFGGIR